MYEETYSTDWTSLSREQSIKRAFALGVATGCGYPNPTEYDRLVGAVETAYDRSIVELAFQEGVSKGKDKYNNGMTSKQVWETLVEHSAETPHKVNAVEHYLPGALGRAALFTKQRGPPELLDRPSFLTKD